MRAGLHRHRQPDLGHPTEDVYKGMQENSWLYDTSNYPKDHQLYNKTNKKVLGKMKDECGGDVRSKMYSVLSKKKHKEGEGREKKM